MGTSKTATKPSSYLDHGLDNMLASWPDESPAATERDAAMPKSAGDVQISFRASFDLKMRFEQALLFRSAREGRRIYANHVLVEKIEEFIAEEEKLRP